MDAQLSPYRLSTMAATLLLGLMAGFFFAFAIDVAPAMTHLRGPAYVEAQQWINREANAWRAWASFGCFVAATVLTTLSRSTARRVPTSRHGIPAA